MVFKVPYFQNMVPNVGLKYLKHMKSDENEEGSKDYEL